MRNCASWPTAERWRGGGEMIGLDALGKAGHALPGRCYDRRRSGWRCCGRVEQRWFMARRWRVALLIETSNAYACGLLRGIRDYVAARGDWSVEFDELSRGQGPPGWLKRWDGDGVLARTENPRIARVIEQLDQPVVDLSAGRHLPQIPATETDDDALAQLAVEHFTERAFRQFGFYGDPRYNWSCNRRDDFVQRIEAAGMACSVHERPAGPGGDTKAERRRLERWLVELPKPVGVLACYDAFGRRVLEACRRMDLAVPEEVAVLGVDNDELICDLADPPLSSIAPDCERTGYAAAELLQRIMNAEPIEATAHRFPPLGVVGRQSTDALAVEDPDLTRALRFIRENACDGITVQDVVDRLPLSRRVLENRLMEALHRTPHEQILRVQIDRAKQLLRNTSWSLVTIAERCGFRRSEYLSVVFKRHTGQTPSDFRQSFAEARSK